MYRLLDKIPYWVEAVRHLSITAISCIAAYFHSTQTFMFALMLGFGFNIFAGLKADDVTIKQTKNFKKKKLSDSLKELTYIIVITYLLKAMMELMNRSNQSVYAVEILTWLALYHYFRNSFRNLVKVYPNIFWMRAVYHLISFQFKQILPDSVNNAIEIAEKEEQYKSKNKDEKN